MNDYNRGRLRFDRNRLLIGAYCVDEYARDEKHVRMLKRAGIDFLLATPADPALLPLLEKYSMGVFATGIVPGWWGGDGDNAGTMAEKVSVADYERAASKFADHPAIWGVDLGDEPSALDFDNYAALFKAAYRLFPNQLPYLNLYPNYASVPQNGAAECVSQLGTPTYERHIAEFVEKVDCDYVCYDHYMYSRRPREAYQNLITVSDACRRAGRDMWIVLQANSNRPEEWITIPMLRHQAYTALAFGAQAIEWACWTAGWWHNQILDEGGAPTRQYGRLCAINRELRALSGSYMSYRCADTHFIGESDEFEGLPVERSFDAGAFGGVALSSGAAIMGHMVSADGEALMVADCRDLRDEKIDTGDSVLSFELSDGMEAGEITINGLPAYYTREGGRYEINVEPNCGIFITARRAMR